MTNHLNEHEVQAVRQEAVSCAESLVQRTAPFLLMVRRLAAIRSRLPEFESDPDFLLFTAIDSQSDHIPIESARPYCAQTWLEKCDAEIVQLELFYEQQVFAACQRIVERFSHAV